MRARGLEPPLPFGNQILNLARLPIPPRPHEVGRIILSSIRIDLKERFAIVSMLNLIMESWYRVSEQDFRELRIL